MHSTRKGQISIANFPLYTACKRRFPRLVSGKKELAPENDQPATERIGQRRNAKYGSGIRRDALSIIIGEDPFHPVPPRDFGRFAARNGEEKESVLDDAGKTFVRAAGRGRLPRPIGRRRREPPRRQKPVHALIPLMCSPSRASAPWLFDPPAAAPRSLRLAKGSIPEQEQLQERNGHAASNQPLWPNDRELRWNRSEEKNARDPAKDLGRERRFTAIPSKMD
jgi:hypothetical protein